MPAPPPPPPAKPAHLQPPPRPASPWRINASNTPGKPFILVPLYIYPTATAWKPLYEAAEAHPAVDFYVVINPANGPGDGELPDANYVDALVRLTALENVRVIGYVHVSYGARVLEEVVVDVERYSRWEAEMVKHGEEGKVCLKFSFSLFFFFFLFLLCEIGIERVTPRECSFKTLEARLLKVVSASLPGGQ